MSESGSSEVRELVSRERRRQVLDAATRVFARRGFRRATTKEVAREAGISEGTIYNYFENKDSLLIGIMDRLNETERRAEDFGEGMSTDFRGFLWEYLRRRMNVMRENREVFRVVLSEVLVNPELRERYLRQVVEPTMLVGEESLRSRMVLGEIRDADAPLIARSMAGAMLGLLMIELLGDEMVEARPDKATDALVGLLLDGLGTGGQNES